MLARMPESRPDGIVFFGTPLTAARCLALMVESGIAVDLVVTAEPKRRGRGSALVKTAVHEFAESHAIPVVHDLDAVIPRVEARGGQWLGVVVAYGRFIPNHLLARLPLVNLHFSLLPRWRGAAPVERAILAGDREVGVCIMRIVEALDEGDVFARASIEVGSKDADELRERLCVMGSNELLRLLDEGWGVPVPQSGESSYARKISKDERRIKWTESAEQVVRVTRIGGAYTELGGQRVKITKAHQMDGESGRAVRQPGELISENRQVVVSCGSGHVVLDLVQPAGRSVMSALDWRNGLASTLDTVRFD